MSELRCHNPECGKELAPPHGPGRLPKWCSQRCRKQTLYTGTCERCGGRTGCNGTATPSRICATCHLDDLHEQQRRWSVELIVARLREWAELYGEPPAGPDWMPWKARRMHDEERARRFERAEGYWPAAETVFAVCGSWNAAMSSAGFVPREAHGGGENVARRRPRAKAAA